MQGETLRNWPDTRAAAPRARYALILPRPKVQYTFFLNGRTKF
jgi:hypothetical protein